MPANESFQMLWWGCELPFGFKLYFVRNTYSRFHIPHYPGCPDRKPDSLVLMVLSLDVLAPKQSIPTLFIKLVLQSFIQTDLWFRELCGTKAYYVWANISSWTKQQSASFIHCGPGFGSTNERLTQNIWTEESVAEEVYIWLNILSPIRWHQWNWSNLRLWIWWWDLNIFPLPMRGSTTGSLLYFQGIYPSKLRS